MATPSPNAPVVPDNAQVMPVAPVANKPIATSVPTETVAPRPGTASGFSEAYAQAAQSGDPEKMLQFIKSAQGTEFEQPAMNAWRGMANRVAKFDEITSAVEKKGGPQSPAGKLELVNQWPKTQNEPSILKGIVEHLLGNPNARYFVSKGMVKPKMVMDINGKPIQENYYENGDRAEPFAIDPITGKEILPKEYGERLAGITDVQQTLPYVATKEQLKFNTDEANKANSATNDLAAASKELSLMHTASQALMYDLFKSRGFQDLLSPDERSQMASFASRAVQLGGSSSQSAIALDQYVRDGGRSLSEEQRKTLGSALGPFGFQINAEGSIVDKQGQTVSNSKLKNLQQTGSFGKTFEQTFNQNVEQAKKELMYSKMDKDQQQLFDNVIDTQKRIEMKKIEIAQKHGAYSNLPFLMSSNLPEMGDQFARFAVQEIIGVRNADLIEKYADYRADMLKKYPPGSAPAPGEIERAFTRTETYKQAQAETQKEIRKEMTRINQTFDTGAIVSKRPVGGEKPQTAVEANAPALGQMSTALPTESNSAINMPSLVEKQPNPLGLKVIRNSDRKFTVKE